MKEIDWSNLSFGYMKTDYNVRCYYRNGAWGEIETCSEETIPLHMAATCLHYGQEAFEGLKAYRCPDGKVRVFRADENAARLQSTCRGILMPELPTEKFIEMVEKVVRLNERFIPPYESGATLYIRPLLIGTSAQVGVHPASEYLFLIFVIVAMAICFVYNRYAPKVYQTSGTVLIKEKNNEIDPTAIMTTRNFGGAQNIDNEIAIMTSYTLIERVVKKMGSPAVPRRRRSSSRRISNPSDAK